MSNMKIYNSLTRSEIEFFPLKEKTVTIYTCGPTVYDYQHIGNLRTATLMDVVRRSIGFLGYKVYSVMNITDVEDKIERRAVERGVSVDEIIKKYEDIYYEFLALMNIHADYFPHASEHIEEQIAIIKNLEEKGFTYLNEYGVYFDTSKDSDYGKLGNTAKSDKASSRIELTEQKKNPADFVLWRLPLQGEKRQKLWDSPWGVGYPGWHIECSAMSMKHLSQAFDGQNVLYPEKFETIDIHLGGEDLKEVHHENEIAQSESATAKPFVKIWMHGSMLNITGDKMSKSLNNFITLKEVLDRGINPLALRLFYFSAHYRKILNFSWEALDASENQLKNIYKKYAVLKANAKTETLESNAKAFESRFKSALENDFNMPEAVAVLMDVFSTQTLVDSQKILLIEPFDEVLGLKITESLRTEVTKQIPEEIMKLAEQRQKFKTDKNWGEADRIRDELKRKGYEIKDRSEGFSFI
jgi:cysteinyl-tRNA synthetase